MANNKEAKARIKINKLLEVLPYDVSEFMLVEFLNNLMVAARQ